MKRGKATSSCCVVSSLVLLLARLVSRTHAESKVFDMTRIARLPCPEGTEWATVWESFYMNQNFHEKWKFDAGPETSSGFDTEVRDGDIIGLGLRMNVSAGIGKSMWLDVPTTLSLTCLYHAPQMILLLYPNMSAQAPSTTSNKALNLYCQMDGTRYGASKYQIHGST